MHTCLKLYFLKKTFEHLLLFNKSLLLMRWSTKPDWRLFRLWIHNRLSHILSYNSHKHILFAYREDCILLRYYVPLLKVIGSLFRLFLFKEVSYPIATSSNPTSFFQAHPKFRYHLLYFSLSSEIPFHFGYVSPPELTDHIDL